ncbi:uncharacterized protein LOC127266090 [Andrographis paniculata]|uniref:uncharacterized protein LOC127266090 n=1 Tax=Andrographis paniculata TaxID=175694 RepID=UPI0021E8E80F|nr:uncharacterized protein LOC127266090 [Andrographis paniculata]
MSSSSKAWIAAVSIGAVEALKDQAGFCRWNYAFRILQQQAKTTLRSYSSAAEPRAQKLGLSGHYSSSMALSKNTTKQQSEDSLRTVMYLSCWGPN